MRGFGFSYSILLFFLAWVVNFFFCCYSGWRIFLGEGFLLGAARFRRRVSGNQQLAKLLRTDVLAQ